MKTSSNVDNLPLAQTVCPATGGNPVELVSSLPKKSLPDGADLNRLLLVAILLMAGAFIWTCWNVVHALQAQPTQWLLSVMGSLAVCLLATAAVVGTVFWSRHAAARNTRLVQGRDLLLRTLIDNLPDAIYAKDAAGRKILANPADLKNLRRKTEAEVIGKSDFDVFPREVAEKFHADDQKVIQGHAVINREEYFLNETGEKRWLMTSKLPLFDQAGKIVGLVGIGRDITERRQAEAALQASQALHHSLVTQLPIGIFRKDERGRFVLVNPGFCQLKGMKAEEFLGKTPVEVGLSEAAKRGAQELTIKYADQGEDHHRQIMETGEPIERDEEYALPDGQKLFVHAMKFPVFDPDGKIVGTQGVLFDITERRRAEDALHRSEEKLRQFTAQLEHSNRELQDFAYVASHDLQEPLRKIVVFGERLKEECGETLATESRGYLERMQKAAARMQTLINDLLAFSRVTTKARPFAPVNLAEVAREVVNDLEARMDQVKGRVEIGELPVIDAEALQMRQLLQNLIGNALKFRRPEAPPVVRVAARKYLNADGLELCELTVSDNGIGFNEKYLDRIFNVFQRLHTRNEFEGNGMGLAIVKKIALYHGGDITAKSEPGAGASFILTLPATHPKDHEPHHT
jgi:PAS domain S-box-containing protein